MSFERFEQLLERTMGLSAASIGTSAIERAVGTRLRACKLENADDYWTHVQRSPDEVQKLVEAVVVPETWFYRDPQAFAAMVRIAMKDTKATRMARRSAVDDLHDLCGLHGA